MKILKLFICLVFLTSVHNVLLAEDDNYYIYGALGFAYSPSSLRFGIRDFESGLLNIGTNGTSIGAVKLFRKGSTFAGVGIAYHFTNALGFHGTVGKQFKWFSWLKFRVEFNGEVYTDSFTQGNGLIGWEVVW